MTETKIKISSILENQLPEFVKEEFPLVSEFLKQYYISLESQGSTYDLISKLDQYVKVDTLSNLVNSTSLTSDISFFDTTINVQSTSGFPDTYGLILIDSEIISYIKKTDTSFIGCVRGFSGITSLDNSSNYDQLTFSDSLSQEHIFGSEVRNLSILFLQKFFLKLKKQITPGFEDRSLFDNLNERIFIKQSVDFYSSKGTEGSFEILFRALYGQDVEVIRPRDYLIQPSDAQYRITKDLVVEQIDGDINQLLNKTVYQDENFFIKKARGTVTQVEKIQRSDKEYYVLSLDLGYQRDIDVDGTIFGTFSIHPKTLLVTDIKDTDESVGVFSPSSTALDVDSTVGFPQSGELLVDLENGSQILISYTDKTITQFLNCNGISQEIPSGSEIKSNTYAYGYGDSLELIKFRVTGVISNANVEVQNPLFSTGDPIKIKTLGDDISDEKFNNWFFNIRTYYTTKLIEPSISSNNLYSISFYVNHSFVVGDKVSILPSYGRPGSEIIGTVISYKNEKTIIVSTENKLNQNESYDVKKILSKFNSNIYQDLKDISTNVQNVYIDDKKSLYVASQSLPSYLNEKISVNDRSVTFSGSFSGETLNIQNHPFYTGDSVYYRSQGEENNLGIPDGFYFVRKINVNAIQLAKSREDLFNDKNILVSGVVSDNKLEFSSFVYENNGESKKLEPQKLIRKISEPVNDEIVNQTLPGATGILINGVEILNYKSQDNIFYGPIEEILVSSSGFGYDIINPPVLQVLDSVGTGVTAFCNIKGNLERIEIIDGGFDYLEDPEIIISGGNGFSASAKAKLVSFDHFVDLNATPSSNAIDTSNNQISFIEDHKFRDHERVVYLPQDQTVIGGLSTNSSYFVSIVNSRTIKLHNTFIDSVSGINTISITNTGNGIHRFKSFNKKKKIGSIDIVDAGSNYENKKRTCTSAGINTALNIVSIKNHGYSSGEIITYEFSSSSVLGLSSTSKYYVTKIDNDNFKLSLVGTSTTQPQNLNYTIGEYINFESPGDGIHIFNYEPITVIASGRIGVSTLSGQDFNAILQPIFRGNIESVHIQSGGNSFGSEEILNYNRQPEVILLNGSGAQLTPVINNGSIIDVIINDPGSNYNCPPNINVTGSGVGAVLTPIVSNGSIVSVNIVFGGIGYTNSDTSIQVTSAGSSAKFVSKIKSWKVNLFDRLVRTDKIFDDGGVLGDSFSKFGLQYFHLYAPQKLRSSVFGKKYRDGEIFYKKDLQIVEKKEVSTDAHSPIIGWAYDGNPIYGPYGYSTSTGGIIKSMVSGYQLRLLPNRPSTDLYPAGFFIEDYEFVGNGDLDEHNGRFCVTPEYPNGVYAYFATISDGLAESSGPFAKDVKYKLPIFPYFIGNTYKSKPEEFNFSKLSNQIDIDINSKRWLRNTTPYNLINSNSGYDFLYNPNNIKEQTSRVNSVSKGNISFVGIIAGGNNYKVNDKVVFEDTDLSSIKPKASVSFIAGKEINSVSVATSEILNLEFYKYANGYVAFSSSPHYINNLDILTFTSDFENQQNILVSIPSNNLVLSTGIGSTEHTGIITYFNVFGDLSNSNIRENDIYEISDERIKILEVDEKSSRIKVIRNIDGISGIESYSAGIDIREVSRKIYLNLDLKNTYNSRINKQIYFNPVESLGIGTTSGVGINTTLIFSNPGVGQTQVTIPTRSIYLPNHQLETGDELIYSSNGGNQISISTDGVFSYQLSENSIVYVNKINQNQIGITSNFGVTTGEDLLYLTGVGSGKNHSFSTNYQNVLTGNLSKNEVTVSTASSHQLRKGDSVIVNIIPRISTQISVQYNEYNRRIIVNKLDFLSSDIDTARNTITIPNHGLYTSQKIIYTSSSPSGGLSNEGIYYVIVVDKNTIKLSNSYYYSARKERNEIDITSASFGSISPINPPLEVINGNTLVFDLSSSTLSFTNNGIKYSAFDLDFYTDSKFKHKFNFTDVNSIEVSRIGKVGIDTNAAVILKINDSTPRKLYYKLTPINLSKIPSIKKEVIIDDDISSNNEINVVLSGYNGTQTIVGASLTTFSYLLLETPEKSSYDKTNSSLDYITNSTSEYGEIKSISVDYVGKNLSNIPKIENILSSNGSGSILEVYSDNIGKVIKTSIDDIGFDYSCDYSIRPTAKLPDQIKIVPQSSFKTIGISSVGKDYSIAPDLVVLDGFTKKIVSDVDLQYQLDSRNVNILKNTKSINNITPIIIPINNTNGVKIDSIVYDQSSGDVTVTLGSSFSNAEDFPFIVGDKVLIENVSVGVGSTSKGYNSSNYDYSLFTITSTTPNIGGIGATVSYNISDYLSDGESPGIFDSQNSSGRIIPQKYFPLFDIELQKNTFIKGEIVFSGESYGVVINWDEVNEILKVSTNDTFSSGRFITGKTSESVGIIGNIITSNVFYDVEASSDVIKGWQRDTGFLNNNFQRIHDNDYYQYFSYSLRSQIPLDKWNNPVSNLNHTAGFKRFSDLVIESSPIVSGISTEQNFGDFSGIADLSRSIDLNCVYDFDLVSENNIIIDNDNKSDEIIFQSRVIQDYIESIGNRVLLIDDISNQFNSNPRPTKFSVVNTFRLSKSRSIKFLSLINDRRFNSQKQSYLISIIHDGSNGYINQYAGVDTYYDLGYFDFNISGDEGNLLFYPNNFTINNYDINTISFNISDSIVSTGSTDLGDIVFVGSSSTSILSGTSSSTRIVGIASTYRASKVLVQIGATDSSYYEFNEITILHDDTNIILEEYGSLNTSNLQSYSSSGIGTYHAYYSGSDINIDLIPYEETSVEFIANVMRISIASTQSTGIGTEILSNSRIESTYTAISSSPTPGITTIASYDSTYDSSYYIVCVEDLTNSQYKVSEIIVTNTDSEVYYTEFGILESNSSIGSIGATIFGGNVDLTFTPNPNIDAEVRIYKNCIGAFNSTISKNNIDFGNSFIRSDYGFYTGTETDVRREFTLTHKGENIFERIFDSSDSNIIDIENNTIQIPENFFVTGENIIYSFDSENLGQAIGIATTTIPGIGSTDKMPSSLYIIKENELKVKVAASASDALRIPPNPLDITQLGVGTIHRFTSKNQNSRVLISIDNLIQSPIVATAITTTAGKDIDVADDLITFSGITSFFGGDLIKIDDEIMRINSVGFGSTNIVLVQRPWMGTGITTHQSNSLITKVKGNFNIVNNTIHFASAPYGPIPIGTTTNPPDSIDFVGIETNSMFSGRTFIRSGISNNDIDPYAYNYVFDDISLGFDGNTDTFTLKSNGSNITGISTNNSIILLNDILQGPSRVGAIEVIGNYNLSESLGITSISFTGTATSSPYDINSSGIPRGGVIVSVGSTAGFGYQPLVSAGGTAIVSIAGTIASISIGNSGSGYRSGIQIVNVGVVTSSTDIPNITYIGIATVTDGHVTGVAITNPGVGYTTSNPPIVIFDSPLSYSNIPLIYSSSSSGVGTFGFVDIVVGQGSSIISFDIVNSGYGYGQGEVLTVSIGGTTGIPTNTSLPFEEFQIFVDKTFTDEFTGWSVGDLQVIDPIDSLFDGVRKTFPIKINGEQTTIRSKKGSNIEVKANLLIFINDILQVPDVSYTFNGGSVITFKEAPKIEDTSKILFYRGTGEIDTLNVNILETVKEGDTLKINSDTEKFKENSRLVTEVVSTDILETNIYSGPGLSMDETLFRPVIWCRQTEDMIINGNQVSKSRILYEPLVTPTSNLIQSFGIGSTQIFVESVKTFFDSADEYSQDGVSEEPQRKIIITSQDQLVSATATAIVSTAGTISSVVISDGGVGYSTNPTVIIENPIGLGVTQRATAVSTISIAGTVSSITISNSGTGYTATNPPIILISPPEVKIEVIDSAYYDGDFGVITGVNTTSVGVASTGIIFDLFIPQNSFLRDTSINPVGIATTGISGIQTGYYFVTYNSNIGNGLTSLYQDGSILSIGSTYMDNIYEVASVSIGQTDVIGVGLTYVAKVTVSVSDYNGLTGLGYSSFFGEYSWGRIYNFSRSNPKEFTSYNNGLIGISTSPIVQRYNPLKYRNYVS